MKRLISNATKKKVIDNCPIKIANLPFSVHMDFPSLQSLLENNEIDVDQFYDKPSQEIKRPEASKIKEAPKTISKR